MNPDPSALERHSRKCAICTHPDRQAIDEAFLHLPRRVWADDSAQRNIVDIVKDYNLPSPSPLYRHAHATGLWQARNSNRENEASPPPQSNSNRESNQLETEPTPPNRENRKWFSDPNHIVLNAEIQRMLIGK